MAAANPGGGGGEESTGGGGGGGKESTGAGDGGCPGGRSSGGHHVGVDDFTCSTISRAWSPEKAAATALARAVRSSPAKHSHHRSSSISGVE